MARAVGGLLRKDPVEEAHLPFRREWAVRRFGQMQILEKFASVHANVQDRFSLERHLSKVRSPHTSPCPPTEWQILFISSVG
jgi:hypothetical protein